LPGFPCFLYLIFPEGKTTVWSGKRDEVGGRGLPGKGRNGNSPCRRDRSMEK
jgi:hypothetical protein